MVADLLLEIGTEEIPSSYLEDGVRELRRLAEASLRENLIEMGGGLYSYGTPRRLVLIGKAIADEQNDLEQEITGPPKRAAFDEDGNPTKAALGFAQKQGVSVNDLQTVETPKGEYIAIRRRIPGRPTREVLSEILPKLIADIPWPKSMRWGFIGFSFVRPIHWVLALFSSEVIRFDVAGVRSGNKTKGHRFMASGFLEINGLQDYLQKMGSSSVIIDQKER
jgi:glycyl-tRNA synthetase beta chain